MSKKKANCQADGEGIAVVNAVSGDFVMHRRLVLAVAMEVGDREEDEDFTADNAAEGGVDKITVVDDGAGGAVRVNEKEVD